MYIVAVLYGSMLYNMCKVEQFVLTILKEDYYYYYFSQWFRCKIISAETVHSSLGPLSVVMHVPLAL